MAAAFRIIQTCFVWFLLPESLTTAQMHRASAIHKETVPSDDTPRLLLWLQRLFFFLKPLAVLLPEKVSPENSLKGAKRDWNLPILALVYGLMLLAMVRTHSAACLFPSLTTAPVLLDQPITVRADDLQMGLGMGQFCISAACSVITFRFRWATV